MSRQPSIGDSPEQLLARAFASQVGRWLEAETGSPGRQPVVLRRIMAAAEAVALATSGGQVCLEIVDIDADDPTGLREALLASAVVAAGAQPDNSRPLVLDQAGRLYLHRYFDLEQRLARRLMTALRAAPQAPGPAASALLQTLFADSAAQLAGRTDWQQLAVAQALGSPLSIISGGPGTGKTSTVVKLLACLLEQDPSLRIALAAPTGKAAARLVEAITARAATLPDPVRERIPRSAQTLHRLLGATPRGGQNGLRFRHDRERPLPIDLLVVDEASMLDLAMATRLLEAVPSTARIVLLGDKNQLSAVEAGAVFAELSGSAPHAAATPGARAVKEAGKAPQTLAGADTDTGRSAARAALQNQVTWLVDSWRFGADSPIGRLASEINQGDRPAALARLRAARDVAAGAPLRWIDEAATASADRAIEAVAIAGFEPLFETVLREARAAQPDRAAVLAAFERFRVLCAVHAGPRGVDTLNLRLAEAARRTIDVLGLPDDGRWYEGRPVVMLANDYAVDLFNGDIGVSLHDDDGRLQVWFADAARGLRAVDPVRLPRHRTAYAMTAHQAQGSEFDEIFIVLPSQSSRVTSREWLYTAVTRARQAVTLAGPAARIGAAIDSPTRRRSGLLSRLDEDWSRLPDSPEV